MNSIPLEHLMPKGLQHASLSKFMPALVIGPKVFIPLDHFFELAVFISNNAFSEVQGFSVTLEKWNDSSEWKIYGDNMSEYQPALICSLYYFNLAVTSAYFTGQNAWCSVKLERKRMPYMHTHKSDIPTSMHNNLKVASTSLWSWNRTVCTWSCQRSESDISIQWKSQFTSLDALSKHACKTSPAEHIRTRKKLPTHAQQPQDQQDHNVTVSTWS